jgi:DNA-binding MarR family transcriptional regulator
MRKPKPKPKNGLRLVIRNGSSAFPPLTVTSPSLLIAGSDAHFRELLVALLDVGSQVHELRLFIAQQFGVSEPQYRLILAIAQMQQEEGVSIGAVAGRMWVTNNFVTMEVRKLQAMGWVEKRQNPDDGRGVLLRLSQRGRKAFTAEIEIIQSINNVMFDHMSAEEFAIVSRVAKRLVVHGRQALELARAKGLVVEAERKQKSGSPASNARGRR